MKNIYESMTAEDENFRFDLIMDQVTPDLSSLYPICPKECRTCNESSTEIVCRVCCHELFTEPVSIVKMMTTQNSFSGMIYNWLVSTLDWAGLTPVFSSWLQDEGFRGREGHDMASQEVKALIRRYHWQRKQGSRRRYVPPTEAFQLDRDDDFSVHPGQVCGYYEADSLRERSGRIMGGTEVSKTRQFPWQMSLATGFMGMFYQHRCGAALLS